MFTIEEIKPLFNGIVTTAHVYSEDVRTESGLYLGGTKMAGSINPYQWVVAVGPTVRDIKVGDIVCINFKRYAAIKHVPGEIEQNIQKDNMSYDYKIPYIEMSGRKYLRLFDNDIEYIVTKFSGVDDGGLLE
jgi:hypothetical protein